MKIAFLNIYNGVVDRGSEVFVKEIAANLSQKHAVCVFQTGRESKEKYRIQQILGIPFNPFGLLYDFWVLIFTLKCLPFLWKEKCDWLIPINGRWQTVLCRLLRLFRGGKILISGHAGVGFEDRFNILIGNPDIFIALSTNAFTWAKTFIDRKKLYHIPNGVDINHFSQDAKPAKVSIKKPLILCVGALVPYKRIDFTIRAVSILPKINLLMIGDGPLRKDIVSLGNKLLGVRFNYIQNVKYEDMPGYYKTASIFTLMSEASEAFGIVYLESLACNVPVVAPADANRKEIIGNAGLYVNSEDIDQYAKKLDEASKTDFGNKPRLQAERYSWNIIARRYEQVLLGPVE